MKPHLRLVPTVSRDASGQSRPDRLATARLRAEVFSLVYRQMHTLAGRSADFDDLVQMAAEQVFRSLSSFQERCSPETWTYRICYYTLRKQRRWYRRWLRRFWPSDDGQLPEPSIGPESSDALEARERTRRLYRALDQLSPKRRTVVVLHDLDELDVEEIAAIVGANVLTVRSRLRDGRRLLADKLRGDPYFGDEACAEEQP